MSDTEDLPIVPMELGLRVDILDNEGIWNTGSIVDVSRDEEDMVEIKYDGWGDEYNEWIPLSAHRLAPLHMFTMVKKCWAKLTKWPWWPAFVVLRAPTKKSAADALNAESKIYVEFFDSYNEEKRSRCWMQKKNIASFQEGFDERASKNIGKNFPAYVEGTQRAMAGGSPVLFTNNGTLPIEYSSKYTEPLEARKQALAQGDESKWFDAYRIFSNRYRVLYGYDFARDSAKTLIAAQHAQGKRAANGAGAKGKSHAEEEEEDDDDDDDEVEIIETVAPVKRGRGRPPGKQAKKQPKREMVEEYDDDDEDDDEQEQKGKRAKKNGDDEYEDAGEDEEVDDEEEEAEDSDSARGRRSSRLTKKRKPSQADDSTPTRRATRPRRAKDDDEEGEPMDEDDDYGDEGEDFNHYEYEDRDEENQLPPSSSSARGRFHGSASSRSTSPDKRYTPRTRTSKKVHKRSALKELLAATKPQPVLAAPSSDSRLPSARSPSLPSKPVMRQLEAFLIGAKTKSTGSANGSTNGSSAENSPVKVKIKPDSPHRAASHDTNNAASSSSSSRTVKTEASPLRYWLGFGAANETGTGTGAAHKPWSIQSWLLNGFQRKHDAESDKSGDGDARCG